MQGHCGAKAACTAGFELRLAWRGGWHARACTGLASSLNEAAHVIIGEGGVPGGEEV